MSAVPFTLICFAVKEEASPFRKQTASLARIETLITGMGPRNAATAIRDTIAGRRPALVLTCGFAGGLNPGLEFGTVIFEADPATQIEAGLIAAGQGHGEFATQSGSAAILSLESALLAAGARAGKFHCAVKVATTVQEKRTLWESTGADAVEMESQVIREVCRDKKIPSATVRVILDSAEENLPLDFNQLLNERDEMDYGKLAMAIAKSPGKIGALMRFQKQTQAAAEKLAEVLLRVLNALPTKT
jgi:nucleoside phosphorylase